MKSLLQLIPFMLATGIARKNLMIPLVLFFMALGSSYAQDWPQYLGPDRDGKSPQKNILRTWPSTGPEVLWTAPVGIGFGGPVVKDGKVYLLDRDDKVGDNLRCFDLSTGKELWNFSYSAPGSVMFPGSRSVPTVDNTRVYTCGPYGDLYSVDVKTHKPAWKKNVWKDFGGEEVPQWAIAQCPLIYGDMLIVASQAPQAGVVAYDKLTGDLRWKTPSLGGVGYVSPSIVKIDGKDQIVMISASERGEGGMGKIVGIAPSSGEVLWTYDKWNCHIPVPSAVDAGENRILVVGGYELGATMIKVIKKADGTYGANELFTTVEFGDQTKTPILHNGYFYAQYGTNNRRDGLVCMDMKGNITWKTKRSPDFNKGSMILADGLLLATDGAKTLYLIEPNPARYNQIASAEMLKEGTPSGNANSSRVGGATQNWAPIALADGKLLIRDQSQLICVKVAK